MADSNEKKMLKTGANKICTLPDGVLHHILSFLDMKEVVATSLLSTRWRYLWVSLRFLNFSDSMWKMKSNVDTVRPKPMRFMNFVDKVLLLRDSSNISKFQIACSTYCDSDRIYEWLTVAARRQFHEVHLELLLKERIKLPRFLFSSSITVLKINTGMTIFDDPIQVPGSVCFSPLLKTLLLCDVMLPEGTSDGELVFSNPVLENLTLKDCIFWHLNVLNISTYYLKNLVFHNDCYDTIESCLIKICTPNLTSIDLGSHWYENCCIGNLSSLLSAKFCIHNPNAQELLKVLQYASCPTTIELCGYLEDDEELPHKLTQPYNNIRSLRFERYISLYRGIGRGSNRFLLKLLNICPCLETLRLDAYEIEDQEEQCPFPITFHHLKYVEIERVTVCRDELKFLKFLLKNAIILEKLVIITDPLFSDVKAKHDFGNRIHSLTRASPRLTVLLL